MTKASETPDHEGDPDADKAPISGGLPFDRYEPVVLQIDGKRAEIHSQIQLYAM